MAIESRVNRLTVGLILLGVGIALLAAFLFGGPIYFIGMIEHTSLPHWGKVMAGSFVCIAAGCYLYAVRRDMRVVYGFLELAFAIFALTFTVHQLLGDVHAAGGVSPGKWPTLGGALYLFVRGCDNTVEGLKEAIETKFNPPSKLHDDFVKIFGKTWGAKQPPRES